MWVVTLAERIRGQWQSCLFEPRATFQTRQDAEDHARAMAMREAGTNFKTWGKCEEVTDTYAWTDPMDRRTYGALISEEKS